MYLGIESGSKKQFKRYCKGSSVSENIEAINILRKIGFNIEVGFIFFDGLATVKELGENIEFIEKTRLYKTGSNLFGSLRIQSCTTYFNIAERKKLIGQKDDNMLSYSCLFKDKEVSILESIYHKWESVTKRLMKILSPKLTNKIYYDDFLFMKEIVELFLNKERGINNVLRKNFVKRFNLLNSFSEYIDKKDYQENF